MAASRGLSREALEAHDTVTSTTANKKTMRTTGVSGYTNDEHCVKRNPQVPQIHRDNRSTKDTESAASLKSSTGATSRHSLLYGPRARKGIHGKWKGGKFCTISLNNRKKGLTVALENTYKTDPEESSNFNTARTIEVVEQTLKEHMDTLEEYDPQKCVLLSSRIADDIKSRVKALGFSRYKVVAHVIIGQDDDQGFHVVSRSLWNTATDNMVPVTYQKNKVFAVAMVFATYYE